MGFLASLEPWQNALVFVLLVAGLLILWLVFRKLKNKLELTLFSSRIARLVGRRVSLLTAIRHGIGTVEVENTLWAVTCDEELLPGTIVDILGANGMILLVKQHIRPVINAANPV